MTTKNTQELVEIELSYDLSISRPSANKETGELSFKSYNCNPNGVNVKVKVPVEATTSKDKLTEYIEEQYSENFCEIVCPFNINIWDEDKKAFRFELD